MFKRSVLSAVAASILATTSVFAQGAPDGAAPVAPQSRSDVSPAERMQHGMRRAHDRLGITPTQQPQWDALVGTLRDNAAAMRADPALQAIRSGRLDAVQELRAASDLARQRADAMQRTIPAVEALYAVLSPEQRQVADREINRMVKGGRHHG